MELPRYVDIGPGILRDIADTLGSMRIEGDFLVVTGPTKTLQYGERVFNAISSSGEAEIISVSGEKKAAAEEVAERVRRNSIDFVIGVGGGKVIDIAKYSAAQTGSDFVSVPTVLSHDGISSSRVSLPNSGGVASIDAVAPIAIIMDTKILAEAPYRFLASGCGDTIAKNTAVLDWQLAHRLGKEEMSEYSCALSMMSAKMVMDSADLIRTASEEGVRLVAKALMGSGVSMSIANSSRPASGSEHLFSHALDAAAPGRALHGEQVGIGTIMMMYLHGGDWESIREFLSRIGAPVTAEELGIEEESIIKALTNAHRIRPSRYTILGSTGLGRAAARRLVRRTELV
jgi:glycerol-1-phosphate dehydrogenase [NAD(P)+]